MTPRRRKRRPPAPGGSESFAAEDLGEPAYKLPVPPARSVIRAVPADLVELTDLGEPLTPEQARAAREARGTPDPDRPRPATARRIAKLNRRVRRLEQLVQRLMAGIPCSEPRYPKDEF